MANQFFRVAICGRVGDARKVLVLARAHGALESAWPWLQHPVDHLALPVAQGSQSVQRTKGAKVVTGVHPANRLGASCPSVAVAGFRQTALVIPTVCAFPGTVFAPSRCAIHQIPTCFGSHTVPRSVFFTPARRLQTVLNRLICLTERPPMT